jgi:hypothetical protein
MNEEDDCCVKLGELKSYIEWFLSLMASGPENPNPLIQQQVNSFQAVVPRGTVPNFDEFCIGCAAALKITSP